MSCGPNPILSATNTFIGVTNFAGYTGSGLALSATSFIPLTTSDGSATGQIVVATKIIGSVPPSSGGRFTSTHLRATGSSTIPAGVLGWSVTAISGTVTVGGVTLDAGASLSGGGYTGYVMSASLAYDATGGVAQIVYDTPV